VPKTTSIRVPKAQQLPAKPASRESPEQEQTNIGCQQVSHLEEIRTLFQKGAVLEIQQSSQGFYSNLFLVPPKDGDKDQQATKPVPPCRTFQNGGDTGIL
jgi:hypothetical protein